MAAFYRQRLPQELKLIVGREVTGNWNLPGILKVLRQELEARERTATSQEGVSHPDGGVRKKSEKTSVAALLAGQRTNRDSATLVCCYCQHNHSSEECSIVTRVEERRRILRSGSHCFVCLRKGHVARECRSWYKRPKYKGRHHQSMCQTGTA